MFWKWFFKAYALFQKFHCVYEHCPMIIFNIMCYWLGVLPWPLHGNNGPCSFVFLFAHRQVAHSSMLSTLFFCKLPHFLISNNSRKGSNLWLSWRTCHGCSICSEIVSKIYSNNAFSIMHWIVNGSSLIINNLFIIFGRNPIKYVN